MSDSEDPKQQPLMPSWQQAASSQPDDSSASSESVLDRARRFLQEDAVKDSSREKKVEFLKSKGLEDADITTLLDEPTETALATPPPLQPTTQLTIPESAPPPALFAPPGSSSSQPDHPPIVTYPEFLTKPLKPPPLITATGLLNALTGIAAASTLVYGATKHLVSPMVTSLTQARVDFHATANTNLTTLVDKLERAVSELPAGYRVGPSNPSGSKKNPADDDTSSSSSSSAYDDPTELFHRDIGVQTSAPPSPTSFFSSSLSATAAATTKTPSGPAEHAASLRTLAVHVRTLAADVVHQTEGLEATMGELAALGTDLHALTYPPESFGAGSTYLYGTSKSEPDDEIHRVKMSIRGVKGVLLSTRSFPATTR